jgi:hypothetical protein
MVKRIFLLKVITLTMLSTIGYTQPEENEEKKISGQPILRVFANFHSQIGSETGASAFEVERAYIGYRAVLYDDFEFKINLDIGSPDDVSEFSRIRRYAYFKNAALKYTSNWFSTSFGLIDMTHFKLQEKFWGHRYIERSFSDRFRFGPSADLGWNFVAQPVDLISVDFTLSNGEGYNNLQRDNTLKAGLGVTVKPIEWLSIRVYGDIMEKSVRQSTLAGFIGYQLRNLLTVGVEYNHKFNDLFQDGYERYGYSAYASYNIWKMLELFARYDWAGSNMPDNAENPWNLDKDGSSIIAGIQYEPIRQIRLALTYHDWFPYAANLDNESYIYLNLEYRY